MTEFRESSHCSQDSIQEDSFVSSTGPEQYSETAIFSGSDAEAQGPPMPSQDQPLQSALSALGLPLSSESPSSSSEEEENHVKDSPSEVGFSASSELHLVVETPLPVSETVKDVYIDASQESIKPVEEVREVESSVHQPTHRSTSVLSRISSDSLSVSTFTFVEVGVNRC